DRHFAQGKPGNLCLGDLCAFGQWPVVAAPAAEGEHFPCPRSVGACKPGSAMRRDAVLIDQPALQLFLRGGKVPAAADRKIERATDPRASQLGEHRVGRLLSEGAEGRPLATDHAELWYRSVDPPDVVAPGNAA